MSRERRAGPRQPESGAVTAPTSKPRVFIGIGLPRTGTTYLYHALQSHPDVFVPYRKESYYFSGNFHKGPEWYAALYADQSEDQIGADINPMYSLEPAAVERILEHDPTSRVVLGVREPISWIVSVYGNMRAHGLEVPPIAEVIRGYDWPLTPEYSLRFALEPGFLEACVSSLREAFGSRLMIYDFALFDRSPLAVLEALEAFLGISHHFDERNVPSQKINASGRRNLLYLNRLLANQRFLELVYATTPTLLIRRLRRLYEKLAARRGASEPPAGQAAASPLVSQTERAALEATFSADRRYYAALFEHHSILSADGLERESDSRSREPSSR